MAASKLIAPMDAPCCWPCISTVACLAAALTRHFRVLGDTEDNLREFRLKVVAGSQVPWHGAMPGDYHPYHPQTEILFSPIMQGRLSDVRKYNLVMDIK